MYEDIILRMLALQRDHDPRLGKMSSRAKDINAFTALRYANMLSGRLVGWAINHQVGLAAEGRKFSGFAPHDHLDHPEYVEQRSAADDHRHELTGGNLQAKDIDPVAARKSMINLLRANPGAFPERITRMMVEALEALDYNEVLPILRPIKAGRKVGYREERMRLEAISFIAYRTARGKTKISALREVAAAFGQDVETIRSWEKRLRDDLGTLAVARAISNAKATAFREEQAIRESYSGEAPLDMGMAEEIYGQAALLRLANDYKAAQRAG
jgi:hypothetical protein